MTAEERTPKAEEIYTHFKGKRYQIVGIASHTETEEQMVVYRALYGDGQLYVRPLAMFVSEVDHEKYPDATQTYRFEKEQQEEDLMMQFLDASTCKEKIEILKNMKNDMDERTINNLAVSMDIVLENKSITAQYEDLMQTLIMRSRYEKKR